MSRFTEILVVSPLADGKTWITRKEFGYDVGEEGSDDCIDVPVGFMTDFTSVPRLFWVFFPRWGKYGNAAVIHDFCYWQQTCSRKKSDYIMREAMGVLSVPRHQRFLIYWAIRLFGWWAWSANKKAMDKGECRTVTEMPIKALDWVE